MIFFKKKQNKIKTKKLSHMVGGNYSKIYSSVS